MIDCLEGIDRSIVLLINSWNHPVIDEIMWIISAKLTWIPLYLFLIYLLYRKFGLKNAVFATITILCTILLADLISAQLLKEQIQRYRPSHNLLLIDQLHFYYLGQGHYYHGGMYGFVSSHATNFFALATSFTILARKTYPLIALSLFAAAVIICYSRIYLGVHYLSDVIGGMILGIFLSLALYKWLWFRWLKL